MAADCELVVPGLHFVRPSACMCDNSPLSLAASIPNSKVLQYNPCSLLDDFKKFVSDMCKIAGDRPVWVTEVSFTDGGGPSPRQGQLTDSPHTVSAAGYQGREGGVPEGCHRVAG